MSDLSQTDDSADESAATLGADAGDREGQPGEGSPESSVEAGVRGGGPSDPSSDSTPAESNSAADGESAVARPAIKRRGAARAEKNAAGGPAEPEPDFGWYILHTLSGNEEKVRQTMKTSLEREGLGYMMEDVLIPVEDVVEVKRGKKHIKKRKLFPGYVFVRMKATEPVLKHIRRLPNLARFVGGIGGSGPVPVTDAEISRIRHFMTETKEKPKIIYEVGETVRIISGPFMDFNGTIMEMDVDRGKLKIQVEIFGRATPVDLEFEQVEKA